jgi:multiple sugar transport system permease protein
LLNTVKNSAFIIISIEIGRLLTASIAAFVFARIRFPFRDKLFLLVLSTMMIPYHVTLVPQYLIFRDLGILDTPYPLILPNLFGGGAFFVFLLRQFFLTIPQDYDDAARIDGCGNFGIYWRIILPISYPALGAVAIFTFMWTWEDFLGPIIYLNSPDNHTVAVAYVNWQRGGPIQGGFLKMSWNHIMAMGTVITLPPILVFFFAQRYFIQGVVISGIKG